MIDYDNNRNGDKKMPRAIKKEHNGPDGHKIPTHFGTIAKYLEEPTSPKSDTLRSPVISSYNVGEMLMEGDLERHYSQKGDDKKNYPQLSVEDYTEVRKDSTGKYVVKKEKDDYTTGSMSGIEKRKK